MLYMQAFAIVLKGKVRPGRTRSDPNDRTACRYDVEVKVRRVCRLSTLPQAAIVLLLRFKQHLC